MALKSMLDRVKKQTQNAVDKSVMDITSDLDNEQVR